MHGQFLCVPKGSDANDDRSLGSAFKTLAKAQEAMRESAGENTAFVRGGTCQLKTP